MGNACCGGTPAIAMQPVAIRPALPQGVIEKVFEFTDISQTAEPLRELEMLIETLQGETSTLEEGIAKVMRAAEQEFGALQRELEGFKAFVPLSDAAHQADYTSEQIEYCKGRIEDLEQWKQQIGDQVTSLMDAADNARFDAEINLAPKFSRLKGMIAGFQKRMLKWKVKQLTGSEGSTHIVLLEQKFNGMLAVVSGLELRIQLLSEANASATVIEQSKALLAAVQGYQSVSERLATEAVEEEIVSESGEFEGIEEKEVASAVLEGDSTPQVRAASKEIETPVSLQKSSTSGFDSSPLKPGFTFPPLVLELEDHQGLLELSGLYSEAQELRATQENSLLRKICLGNCQVESAVLSWEKTVQIFLEMMVAKRGSDQQQRENGDMPLSMDVFVVKFFNGKYGDGTLTELMGFLKGLLAAKAADKPGSLLICKTLNLFTASPYPLPVAQLLPGLLQSLSSPSDQISLFAVMDMVYAALETEAALTVLRTCRPESLLEGEFLVLLCCHRIQALQKDNLFRLIAGDASSVPCGTVTAGIITHLNLPLTQLEQTALLEAVNPANGTMISRMIFNKAFNVKQLLNSSRLASFTLSPMLFAENMLEYCLARRGVAIQNLAGQFENTGRSVEAILKDFDDCEQVLGETEGKSFGATVQVLETRLVGPFKKAYLDPTNKLGLSEVTEVPEYVQTLTSSFSF